MPKLLLSSAVAAFLMGSAVMLSAQTPKPLSGVPSQAFATIQGNALSANDKAVPHANVRLRDARSGRTVDVTTSDKDGAFVFRGVDPGSYIVEVIGSNEATVAASRIIDVIAGQRSSAVVKLPPQPSLISSLVGHTTPSLLAVTAAAAASGILASAVTGQPVSPVR